MSDNRNDDSMPERRLPWMSAAQRRFVHSHIHDTPEKVARAVMATVQMWVYQHLVGRGLLGTERQAVQLRALGVERGDGGVMAAMARPLAVAAAPAASRLRSRPELLAARSATRTTAEE